MKDSDGKRDEIARHYMQKRAERNAEWQWPKEVTADLVEYARHFLGDGRRAGRGKSFDWHVLYVDHKGKQQHTIQAQGEADSSSYWGAANADMKRRDQEGMEHQLIGTAPTMIVIDDLMDEAPVFPARAMAAVNDAPPNRWSHCLGVLPKIY